MHQLKRCMVCSCMALILGSCSWFTDDTLSTDTVEGIAALSDGSTAYVVFEVATASTRTISSDISSAADAAVICGTLLTDGTVGSIKISMEGYYSSSSGEFELESYGTLVSTTIAVSFSGTLSSDLSISDASLSITITEDGTSSVYTSDSVEKPSTAGSVSSTVDSASDDITASPAISAVYCGTWTAGESSKFRGNAAHAGTEITITPTEIAFNGETYTPEIAKDIEYGTQTDEDITYAIIRQRLILKITASGSSPADVGKYFAARLKTKTYNGITRVMLYSHTEGDCSSYDEDDTGTFVDPTLYDTAAAAAAAWEDGSMDVGENFEFVSESAISQGTPLNVLLWIEGIPASIAAGSTYDLEIQVTSEGSYMGWVTLSSSTDAITLSPATVWYGIESVISVTLTAVEAGSSVITGTAGTVSGTYSITVTE